MAVDELGAALGVIADEVEGRAFAAGGGVYSGGAVLEKLAKKRLGVVADAGGFRASDAGLRPFLAKGGGGEIVKAVVFRSRALPVADVRLVPDFPQPGFGLLAEALVQMCGVGGNQL